MRTIDELIEASRKTGRKRIAVAAAHEEAALEAAVDAWMAGLGDPILVGPLQCYRRAGILARPGYLAIR